MDAKKSEWSPVGERGCWKRCHGQGEICVGLCRSSRSLPSRGRGDPGRTIHQGEGAKGVKVSGGLREHQGRTQGRSGEGDPGRAGLARAPHSQRSLNLDSLMLSPHSCCTVCMLKNIGLLNVQIKTVPQIWLTRFGIF